MKKILVFLCLALCMLLLVCSCGGNDTDTDTNTDTSSEVDTSSDTNNGPDLNDGKYRVFVCDKDGNPIAGAVVQFCIDVCSFDETDEFGYVVIPSGEYHIQRVDDQHGVYESVIYEGGKEPHFENGSKLITITLESK